MRLMPPDRILPSSPSWALTCRASSKL
jgi:hypothetical protein